MTEQAVLTGKVDEIIAAYEAKPTALIMILQEVQEVYRYLPVEALEQISKRMDIALAQIYGVATFYKSFSLTPRGKHHVCVCTGTACHVRNSRSIVEKLERDLGIKRGETTEDLEYTLETVNCVGACALGPVVIADGKYWGRLTVSDTDKMLQALGGKPAAAPRAAGSGRGA
ncbi:MAG: NAD(P)H-dependent oxidoreductase subunit E [Candidatus Eisenbacteria bacterium]|nr:NAD(P)H-dependent oxidoreductase subunit E [Candidatus Latescibacterota bacterium]MBD3302565.1 NAD(P)H-dependent oxidoreductase subunit E [Candidatus Eisenbacteria bacterium]